VLIFPFSVYTAPDGRLVAYCEAETLMITVFTNKKDYAWKWQMLVLRARLYIEKRLRSPRGDRLIAAQLGNPWTVHADLAIAALPLATARKALVDREQRP